MGKNIQEQIKKKSAEIFDDLVNIRRHIHQNPELSFQEYKTSQFISDKLKEYGIEHRRVADTGLVAKIKGKKGSGTRAVALRAELDALPVAEDGDSPYKSVNDGVMHACGHDVHAACLLGSARVIKQLENEFSGTLFFIFQPGEESLPGGAKKMLQEDIFEGISPEVIIAQHVFPEMKSGKTGLKPGVYMASADEIYITVSGGGGHGAMPESTVDTVVAMSQIVIALQQISSRFAPPSIPTVLSFGKFIANGATNVIPKEATIEGTFRTMDETWRAEAHELITRIATNTAHSLGASCSVEISKGYPVLINDNKKTARAKDFMIDYLGMDNVEDLKIRMTSEDFSYFAKKYPAVFYRLGTGEPDKKLHTPIFDVDEKIILTGTGVMAWLGLSFLMQ